MNYKAYILLSSKNRKIWIHTIALLLSSINSLIEHERMGKFPIPNRIELNKMPTCVLKSICIGSNQGYRKYASENWSFMSLFLSSLPFIVHYIKGPLPHITLSQHIISALLLSLSRWRCSIWFSLVFDIYFFSITSN